MTRQECLEWIQSIQSQIKWMQGEGGRQQNQLCALQRGKVCAPTAQQVLEDLRNQLAVAQGKLIAIEFESQLHTWNVFYRYENIMGSCSGNEIVKAVTAQQAIEMVKGGYSAIPYEEKGVAALKDAIARWQENF